MVYSRYFLVFTCVALIWGCGDETTQKSTSSSKIADKEDGVCNDTLCDALCVNLTEDTDNCGACGRLCGGGESCFESECWLPVYAPALTCEALLNPGSGFVELSFVGGSGNYSNSCSLNGSILSVTGGNFGVLFDFKIDISEGSGSYTPAPGVIQYSDEGKNYANLGEGECSFCYDGAHLGKLSCPQGTMCERNDNDACIAAISRELNSGFQCPTPGCPAGYISGEREGYCKAPAAQ